MQQSIIFMLILVIISTIAAIVSLKATIKKKDKQLAETMDELNTYKDMAMDTEKNIILSKILKVSMEKDELENSCTRLIRVLLNHFPIDFCTLFLVNKRKEHRIIATNIRDAETRKLIEEFTNNEARKLSENQGAIAYNTTNTALEFSFAKERGVRYYLLIPLIINKSHIASLVIENCYSNPQKCFEEDFFHLVIENAALSVQKFLYDDYIVSMAMKDGLTSVYNRAYIVKKIKDEIEKHMITDDRFTLVILDIDHFKKFNDTYGHLFGDEVLKETAQFFKNNIRTSDYIARYGGEEFILFYPHSTNDAIYPRIEKLRAQLSEMPVTMEVDGEVKTAYITASFGMSEFPTHGQTFEELIETADKALYYSKENGRNRVTKYQSIKPMGVEDIMNLELELE